MKLKSLGLDVKGMFWHVGGLESCSSRILPPPPHPPSLYEPPGSPSVSPLFPPLPWMNPSSYLPMYESLSCFKFFFLVYYIVSCRIFRALNFFLTVLLLFSTTHISTCLVVDCTLYTMFSTTHISTCLVVDCTLYTMFSTTHISTCLVVDCTHVHHVVHYTY